MSEEREPGSNDHSIAAEPHLKRAAKGSSRPGTVADEPHLRPRGEPPESYNDHSVWDEPLMRGQAREGWAEHVDRQRQRTSPGQTWGVTVLLVLAAGPWAVLGAIWGQAGTGAIGVLSIVVIGPAIEEMMKVATTVWVVERRPWLLSSRLQIGLAALAGGLVFAAIENVMYLKVYVPDPSPELIAWRWTVCVALHTGCSTIAGFGVMRAWTEGLRERRRPNLSAAMPMLVVAVVIHGTYNGLAVLLSLLDFQF